MLTNSFKRQTHARINKRAVTGSAGLILDTSQRQSRKKQYKFHGKLLNYCKSTIPSVSVVGLQEGDWEEHEAEGSASALALSSTIRTMNKHLKCCHLTPLHTGLLAQRTVMPSTYKTSGFRHCSPTNTKLKKPKPLYLPPPILLISPISPVSE